jgi:hypothetical protein
MTMPDGAIRSGDFKLIEFFNDMRVELYDIKGDIGEQHDLVPARPKLAEELRARRHGHPPARTARLSRHGGNCFIRQFRAVFHRPFGGIRGVGTADCGITLLVGECSPWRTLMRNNRTGWEPAPARRCRVRAFSFLE